LGDARALFENLLSMRNDLGLLAEEYDPRRAKTARQFSQAFSDIGLINTAVKLRAREARTAATLAG